MTYLCQPTWAIKGVEEALCETDSNVEIVELDVEIDKLDKLDDRDHSSLLSLSNGYATV